MAMRVSQPLAIVLTEVEGLRVAVDHACLLCLEQLVLLHAHQAAVRALGNRSGRDLHLAFFCKVAQQ